MMDALARRARSWAIAGAIVAGLVIPHVVADASEPRSDRKTVLLLYGEARLAPAIAQLDLSMRAHLAKSTVPLDVFAEYLDFSWVDTPRYEEKLTRFLREKYARRRIDVLVPVLANALRFSLVRRAEVFPGAPIVFSAVEPAGAVGLRLEPDVTGVWMMADAAATLETALRLQPDVRRAIVVGGTSAIDRLFLEDVRQDLARHPVPLEVSYLPDLPLHEVRKALTDLPPDTVVLFVSMVRDGIYPANVSFQLGKNYGKQ